MYIIDRLRLAAIFLFTAKPILAAKGASDMINSVCIRDGRCQNVLVHSNRLVYLGVCVGRRR